MKIDSATDVPMAYNSASAEEVAIVDCVLLAQVMGQLKSVVMKPDVDVLVAVHPAQSLSLNVVMLS
eukprot:5111114-Amphidinium_carterae.1